jgi:hypothetical protein
LDGELHFGEKAYDAAEQITGLSRGSLYNIVWVVKRFQDTSLRSESGLKWSHFKELARIADDNVRDEVLGQFNQGFSPSVHDVRQRVNSVLKKLTEKSSSSKTKPPKTLVHLQVSLKPELGDLVKAYAKANRTQTDVLLRRIVTEYFERHKKDIEVSIRGKKLRGSKGR